MTGQTYILFLKRNRTGQDYSLITAYSISDGVVHPLDYGHPGKFTPFDGMSEGSFLQGSLCKVTVVTEIVVDEPYFHRAIIGTNMGVSHETSGSHSVRFCTGSYRWAGAIAQFRVWAGPGQQGTPRPDLFEEV